jgi:RNA polymerase sigma-70 factor (ECF subfamily)
MAGSLEGRRGTVAFPGDSGGIRAGRVAVARRELDKLPDKHRTVVTLRDMHGFDSKEVCELLDISIANQRVLLQHGRAAVRQALETYLADES